MPAVRTSPLAARRDTTEAACERSGHAPSPPTDEATSPGGRLLDKPTPTAEATVSRVHGRQGRSGGASWVERRRDRGGECGLSNTRSAAYNGRSPAGWLAPRSPPWRRCSAGAMARPPSLVRKGKPRSAWGNGWRGPRDPRDPSHAPLPPPVVRLCCGRRCAFEFDPDRRSGGVRSGPRARRLDQSREITGRAAAPERARQTGSRSSGQGRGGVSHVGRRGRLSCKAPPPCSTNHAPTSRRAPTLRGPRHASRSLPGR